MSWAEAEHGFWATYANDMGPYLISAWPTELEAWRDTQGYGHVVFVPWGYDLSRAIKAAEGTK